MKSMDLIVFNVDHGLCVLVRTPNGYGVMIDVGCRRDFSPAEWVADGNIVLTPFNNRRLAKLIVTHPHDDHVEGISKLIKYLPPAILQRRKDIDWDQILNPPNQDPSLNAKEFYRWQSAYDQPAKSLPDYGCDLQIFGLTRSDLESLGGQLQNQVNNGSYVSVFTWTFDGFTWKIVVCGDNETKGLEALLQQQKFRDTISGARILVTPHHGHTSGYSGEFMKAIGNPDLIITSVQSQGESDHVEQSYQVYSKGIIFDGKMRRHLTTRKDGHIWLSLTPGCYEFKKVTESNILFRLFASLR